MKRHYILSLLLGFVITSVCLQGITVEAGNKRSEQKPIEKQKLVSMLYEDDDVSSLMILSDGVSEESKAAVIPDSYDLRKEGLVTPVKHQGSYGTCWSFAAMNSIESSLLSRYPKIDLSEWMVAYYTYCEKFGYPFEDEEASVFDQGGKYQFTSAMLAAGIGAFNERFESWYYGDESITKDNSDANSVRSIRDYQVTDIEYFPYWNTMDSTFDDQLHSIKNEIYNGHALVLNYFNCDDYYYEKYNSYYINEGYMNINDDVSTYHAVSVVGWDDNFPAENFVDIPPMDGAWLCKNSWGENWGDGGYFWLSYADCSIYDVFYLDAEPVQKYSDIHLYDDYGFTNFISSKGNSEAVKYDYMANIFSAEEDCMVTAAMLCTVIPDENYEITVYTELDDLSDPCSGKPNKVTSGLISDIGYHTIDIDDPVSVKAGENYSVVVKIGGKEGYHIACEGYLDGEMFYEDGTSEYTSDVMGKYISKDFKPNQSFISSDGVKWSDNYENGFYEYEMEFGTDIKNKNGSPAVGYKCYEYIANNSIKTFTSPIDSVIFSEYGRELPLGTEISLTAPCGDEIKYSINGGKYKTYTEPFVFNGDMTISAYVNEDKVYEKKYVQQSTGLSSVLVRNNISGSYIYENGEEPGEYIVYLSKAEKSVDIQIISMGDISINGKKAESGGYYTVSTKNAIDTIIVDVSEDGKLSSQYSITFMDFVPLKGDVNTDKDIDISDATAALDFYAKNAALIQDTTFTEEQFMNGDVNEDGEVNIADATIILEYYARTAAGLDVSWNELIGS